MPYFSMSRRRRQDKLDVYAIDFKDEDGDPVAELRERKQTFTFVRRRSDRGPVWRQGHPGFSGRRER
jgi:hypothetical protein